MLSSCGSPSLGGTEAGNPPDTVRVVKGVVPHNESGCSASRVVIADSAAQSATVDVDTACAFSIQATPERAQTLTLFAAETFVAMLTFSHHAALFESNVFVAGSGDDAIDLGSLTIDGTSARAAHEPATQNDLDGDGLVDFDDVDDDNNGVVDVDEQDCDLDGYFNSVDLDNGTCDTVGDIGEIPLQPGEDAILEALPRKAATQIADDQPIKVRANCAIDPDSLSEATFNIDDATGAHVSCTTSLASDQHVAVCEHAALSAETTYTITVEGLSCVDHGDTIRTVTWHFSTAMPSHQ